MPYRLDIDGLRAISVIAIVLFHLHTPFVGGGFIGVDVFFVISGYLISSILLQSLRNGDFSLVSFYERRIRRIFPALVVVVVSCLAVGYFLLLPGDYAKAGKSALYAVVAASNIFFLNNTGYFDAAAEVMVLLHTWSLAVEEQFYLVWPLFFALIYKLCQGKAVRLAAAIIVIILISFATNLWQVSSVPKEAFYLPFGRAWELALGGLLVLLPPIRQGHAGALFAQIMPALGLSLIGWASVTLTAKQSYPHFAALYPVLGAAFVLYNAGQRTWGARILSMRLLVFVGKISYSLYLWHWPVIVFWRHYSGEIVISSWEVRLGLFSASALAAWLSWRWVERPFRGGGFNRRWVFTAAALALSMAATLALTVHTSGGVPDRLPEAARPLMDRDVMWAWKCPHVAPLAIAMYQDPSKTGAVCAVGAEWATAAKRALIWGDSNAEHLLPMLDLVGREAGVSIAVVNPCPAIFRSGGVERSWEGTPDYSLRCGKQRASVVQMLRDQPDISTVLLAARWSPLPARLYQGDANNRSSVGGLGLLRSGLEEVISEISAPGRRIVLVNDIPGLPVADPEVVRCANIDLGLLRRPCQIDLQTETYAFFTRVTVPVHDVLREVGRQRNLEVYSPEDYLCASGRCDVDVNGQFIYRDNSHIRRNMNEGMLRQLVEKLHFRNLLISSQGI